MPTWPQLPLPPRGALREAADPPGPGGAAGPEGDAQRQAAQAARQAMAQVLRQRVALVRDLDAELARIIEQALARVTAQLNQAPTDYQLWVLPRLMEGIQRVLDELAASAAAQASDSLRRAAELGARLVDAPVAAEVATAAAAPAGMGAGAGAALAAQPLAALGAPSLPQLRALQQVNTALIKGAATETVNAINRQLGQVVLGAANPFDAIRAVAALLPDRTRSQIRGIVNTNLATAFNAAAWERLKAQAERDPAIQKQWRRSGKVHSRANHDAADGQVQPVTQPFTLMDGHKRGAFVQLMYPADPAAPVGEVIHCGCVALPWKATWKMRNPSAEPLTPQERADRAAAAGRTARRGTSPKDKPVTTTQDRILAAFAQTPTWRDVTGQPLQIDQRLFPVGTGDARLTAPGRDLYSYHAVQALKRPSEIWQTERIDAAAGELIRERIFLKRFTAAGTTWLGQAVFRLDSGVWRPVGAYTAKAYGQGIDVAMTAARAGARVWPRRP